MLLPDSTKDHAFNALRQQRIMEAITPRELAYLYQVCHHDEYTNKEIAHRLGVSLTTVDGYAKSLKTKFGVQTKQGLVLFAHAWRLVYAPAWEPTLEHTMAYGAPAGV